MVTFKNVFNKLHKRQRLLTLIKHYTHQIIKQYNKLFPRFLKLTKTWFLLLSKYSSNVFSFEIEYKCLKGEVYAVIIKQYV